MKISVQRALDRMVGTLLCGFLSLFPWRYRRIPDGFRPRNILVMILSEMGSLVLARPVFRVIREEYPEASIYLLVFERNRGILEVLDLVPQSHVLSVEDRSFPPFLLSSLAALFKLRRIGVDTALDCELFSRVSVLYSLLSGAKTRAGFHRHTQEGLYRGNLINRPVLYNPYCHISQQFIHLVDSLALHGVPLVKRKVPPEIPSAETVNLDPEEMEDFRERFRSDFPHLHERKLVLLYPGGGLLPVRAWPAEYYSEVAKALVQGGCAIGIVGTEQDRALAARVASCCRTNFCVDLTGYTKTVKELVFLLDRASLLITNDGGPGHFASLVQVPSIVFYGPESPILYGVTGSGAHHFYSPLSCSPCLTAFNHRRSPCDGNNACLKAISPQHVIEKATEILNR